MKAFNVNIYGLYKYISGSKIKPNGHIKSFRVLILMIITQFLMAINLMVALFVATEVGPGWRSWFFTFSAKRTEKS